MTVEESVRPAISDPLATPPSLTDRESQLLRQAGERVFALARKVSAAERREEEIKRELEQTRELLAETRNTRDVLSAQVQSLLRERERDFEERSELRQLLGAITVQLQAAMNRPVSLGLAAQHPPSPPAPTTRQAIGAPNSRTRNHSSKGAGDGLGILMSAARKQWTRLNSR